MISKIRFCDQNMWRLTSLALMTLVVTSVLSSNRASAQNFFEASRDFKVQRACNATRKLNSGEPIALEVGKVYESVGLNKATGATHAFILVGSTKKWAKLSCGKFTDGQGPDVEPKKESAATNTDAVCLPFFDNVDNTVRVGVGGNVDITPTFAPNLNRFDQAVNRACGAPGKVVSKAEFQEMFKNNADVLTRLRNFTGGKVFAEGAQHASNEEYLKDLTKAWFGIKGFDHIFCGEPNPRSSGHGIGGLHFVGRYLQLQTTGDACRMPNLKRSEVVPGVIYSMGVIMRNKDGRMVKANIKGYGLTMTAEDIFKVVTRALKENPTTSTTSTGCVLRVTDDNKTFDTIFVRRASGIRTFFPDATPNQGRLKNPACEHPIDLQAQ